MPGKPLRADKARNREAILNAAAAVLARETDPSLLDIAEEAGISRATIYRHFPDLAAVREALTEEVQELAKDLLQQHFSGGNPNAAFTEWLPGIVRSALPIRTRYAAAMATEPVADAGLHAAFTPMAEALIKQAQARSEIRADLDAAIMAEALISIAFQTARRVYRDGVPVDEAVQVFEVFMRGMEVSPRTI